LGATILDALAGDSSAALPRRPTETLSLIMALQNWRARVAREMAVPAYVVLTDAVLGAIAERSPRTREALARIPGIGPRALAKFSDGLLDITRRAAVDLTPA
jgi:superfamily II DNA helicase RecQ